MKSFLIISALALCLVLMAVSYYLFSKISANSPDAINKADSRDSLRTHAVTDLASKLSFIAQSNDKWPQQWQQIGTAATECQIDTPHCQVIQEECFDVSSLAQNKFVIPVDVARGSTERTGYAIRQAGNTVDIVACYAESETAITQRIRL